jgi:hypothetical protein
LLLLAKNGWVLPYPVVGTSSPGHYSNTGVIPKPAEGQPFSNQNADHTGNAPAYEDHGDGTVTDLVTGLMWQKTMDPKCTWKEAAAKVDTMRLGGHSDWRVPTIKELYSLILFSGQTATGITSYRKFIDTIAFDHPLGDLSLGEREIDAQTWSATKYRGLTMNGDSTVFGVNFIDGRIKGYPLYKPGSQNRESFTGYFRMVRGNSSYGRNDFSSRGDGTISDLATGLMWQAADDGIARDWGSALAYCDTLRLGGHEDWRLPDAKELQSIVDYSRSPSATNSPAIDPVFSTSSIVDPDGVAGQYPYFWASTTHLDGMGNYSHAVYLAFGKAQGKMNGVLMDVHGAGAQRSDPKTGQKASYPQYFGPQGDVQYAYNHARCVRTETSSSSAVSRARVPGADAHLLLDSRRIEFRTSKEANVVLRLRTLDGVLLTAWNFGTLSSGSYVRSLPGFPIGSGLVVAELRLGDRSESFLVSSPGRR